MKYLYTRSFVLSWDETNAHREDPAGLRLALRTLRLCGEDLRFAMRPLTRSPTSPHFPHTAPRPALPAATG